MIGQIKRSPANRASDLSVVRTLKSGQTVLLKFERQGQNLFLVFQLARPSDVMKNNATFFMRANQVYAAWHI